MGGVLAQEQRHTPPRVFSSGLDGRFGDEIHRRESREDAANQGYGLQAPGLGRYQFTTPALRDLGLLDREGGWIPDNPYGALNRAAFLDTPPAQDRAFSDYVERQERYLDRNGATAHIGQKVDGIVEAFVVTLPGLAAAAHRQGAAAIRSYLEHQRAHGWRQMPQPFRLNGAPRSSP